MTLVTAKKKTFQGIRARIMRERNTRSTLPRLDIVSRQTISEQNTHYTSILISTTIISSTNINKNCTFPRFFHSLRQYLGIYHRGVTQISPLHSFFHGTSHTNIFDPCKLTLVPTDRPKA